MPRLAPPRFASPSFVCPPFSPVILSTLASELRYSCLCRSSAIHDDDDDVYDTLLPVTPEDTLFSRSGFDGFENPEVYFWTVKVVSTLPTTSRSTIRWKIAFFVRVRESSNRSSDGASHFSIGVYVARIRAIIPAVSDLGPLYRKRE